MHTNSFNKSNGFTETFKTISKQQTMQFLVKFLVSWVQSVLYRYMASIGNVLARTVWLGHPTSSISFVHFQNDVYIHVPMYHKVSQYTSTETNLFARNHHYNQKTKDTGHDVIVYSFQLARLKSISGATKGKYWNIKCRYIHVGKMLRNEHRSIKMLTCSCWGLCMTLGLWIFMLVTPKLLTFFVILQQRWWNIHQSLMGNPWHSNVTMEMQNVIQRQTLKKCYIYQ